MINFKEFTLDWEDRKIFGRRADVSEAKAVVLLVHGFGEHSGRYTHSVVPFLQKLGLSVVLFDQVGHGRSGGKRGHGPGTEGLLDLVDRMRSEVRSWYPSLPCLLFGHSMGGNLVLNYGLRREGELLGIIASSPYLKLAYQPPRWKVAAGKLLQHIAPQITMPSGIDTSGLSRIPEEIRQYESDLLVHDRISPGFYFPIMEAGKWALEHAGELRVPTLLIHGDADPIVDVEGSREFHRKAPNTTLKIIAGGYHELHHDLDKEEFYRQLEGWIRSQLK